MCVGQRPRQGLKYSKEIAIITNIYLQHRIVHIIVIYVFCTLLKHTNTVFTTNGSIIPYKKALYFLSTITIPNNSLL